LVTRVILDRRPVDPPATVEARVYYNTTDKRPKVCISDP